MMRTLVALLLVALFAGCTTDPGDTAANPLEPSASASNVGRATLQPATNSEDVETASIAGLVTDTELRPIPNASVTLVEHQLTVVATPEGSFRFEAVPLGRKTLEAHAQGFESAAKALELTAEGADSIMVSLAPLDVRDAPFHTSIERRFSLELGYRPPLGLPPFGQMCSQCSANMSFLPLPASWIVETTWQSSSNPHVNYDVALTFRYPVVRDDGWKGMEATGPRYMANREKLDWGMIGNGQRLINLHSAPASFAWLNVSGGNGPTYPGLSSVSSGSAHLNWEHKFSVWTTFAYVEPLAHDFTALPKD